MPIKELEIYRLDIPFTISFKHSSAERTRTQSLWVEAAGDGLVGRGEGCPREYVTNESTATAAAFFAEHRRAVRQEIDSFEGLVSWERQHAAEIDENPAAWCAIELALIDWLARRDGVPVEDVLSLPRLDGTYRYTAVVGDSGMDSFRATTERYRDFGFADFKLKLSGDVVHDRQKIRWLHELEIEGLRVRVDANNLWNRVEEAAEHLTALESAFLGVEEPLEANDLVGLRRLADETGCRMILDESLLREEQITRLEDDPHHWIINLRVSKMGGLLRSLAVARRAREASIPVIVGAQVGETSLLTRAGLAAARCAGDNLLAQEGAFGTLLLESDVADPPLMFGAGGLLDAGSLDLGAKPGWGLTFTGDRGSFQPL
ncbi:MAG TPA: enolase C-terminal domain-like protein [Vicinamibacteria bacterium]|nr:enolase C-terminal domain-like protein [Vicinamibacteria bacterium]